jgi:nicotinamide-nucleotide amidase
MRAEVVAIGDELITGQRLDTNSQWLSERLTEIGVQVAFHTTIGDVLADNVLAFRTAVERADVVVATGGLGPTADDLTREALSAAAGVGLVRDEVELAHIRKLFASRGRDMPERNAVQADLPAGAAAIRNEHGTAPGFHMIVAKRSGPRCHVFALPGVPAEMKRMWFDSVAPAIQALEGQRRVIRHRRIKCFGVGESQLEAMLPDLIRRGREPTVGITVSDATITLRITASGADDAECEAAMAPTVAIIYETLGSIIFGEEDDELEDVVVRLLQERGQSVAVAEWATGGLLGEWLSRASSRSTAFAGDVLFNSDPASLGLAPLLGLGSYLPDEPHAAAAAAEVIRQSASAAYGLAIGAFPAEPDRPDAHVYASIATPNGVRKLRFNCACHPAIRQARTAKQALNALRLILLKQLPGDA